MHRVINKEGPRDHTYESTYRGETIQLYAKSEAAARQKSIEHWHIKKKDVPSISIRVTKERRDLVFVF